MPTPAASSAVRLLLAAALVVLVYAPPAAALELEVPPLPELHPETPADAELILRFTCEDIARAAPASQATLEAHTPHTGITFEGLGTRAIDPVACTDGTMRVPFTIRADRTVFAAQPIEIGFQASLGGTTVDQEAVTTVHVDGSVSVHVPAAIKMGGPQKSIPYAVELQNHANARVIVRAEATPPERGDIVVPDPVVLPAAFEEGPAATVQVMYSTPFENGRVRAQEEIHLVWHVETLEGEPVGAPISTTFLATTKGWYVPGPGLPMALAVLAIALHVSRRRA